MIDTLAFLLAANPVAFIGLISAAFLVVAQLLDFYTTYQILKKGGYEANPFMAHIQKAFAAIGAPKWAWLAITKIIAIALIIIITPAAIGFFIGSAVLAALAVLYSAVLVNNFKVLFKLKSQDK